MSFPNCFNNKDDLQIQQTPNPLAQEPPFLPPLLEHSSEV